MMYAGSVHTGTIRGGAEGSLAGTLRVINRPQPTRPVLLHDETQPRLHQQLHERHQVERSVKSGVVFILRGRAHPSFGTTPTFEIFFRFFLKFFSLFVFFFFNFFSLKIGVIPNDGWAQPSAPNLILV